MIGLLPSEMGAVHETTARTSSGIVDTSLGAPGAVTGVTEVDGSEDRLVNILQGQVACPYERGSVVDVPSPSR